MGLIFRGQFSVGEKSQSNFCNYTTQKASSIVSRRFKKSFLTFVRI